ACDLEPVLMMVRSDGGQEIAPHICAHLLEVQSQVVVVVVM
ncbi:hypothetical protein Tco_1397918, partial [Tanacetum coccineum]